MSFNMVRRVFDRQVVGADAPMTLSGTLAKIALLLGVLVVGAVAGCSLLLSQSALMGPVLVLVVPAGLILAIVTVFWPRIAGYTAFAYAFLQGIAVGAMTLIFEARYPGIALSAVTFTAATAVGMLLMYRLEKIKVTETIKAVIVSATGAIALTYIVLLVLSFFGVKTSAFYESSSITSILFSFFVTGVAAFNLLLDFALIEESVDKELPKYMEWYAAFNMLVTLIWLYVEILRLLSKFARRRD